MLDFWLAVDEVEPISDPWQHTGTIAAAAVNSAAVFAASQGVQIEQRTSDSFRPRYTAQAPESDRMTADEIQAELQKRLRT